MRRLNLVFRLIAAVIVAAPGAAAADTAARIQHVEQGLRAPTSVKGQPQPKWTIAERLAFYKVPAASVAVIDEGKIEWARGYGVTAQGGKPVDAETLFQAASISKHVGAMVALHLVDQGKLALDEDVNLKLRSWKVPENEFTKTQKVTLRRLLNHSAGLTVHGFRGYAPGEPVPTLVELLKGVKPANSAAIVADMEPGTKWRYSGGGYEVMQQLVIDVTGKPFPQLAQEIVIGPLRLTRSTFEQPLPTRLEGNAAAGHRADGSMIQGRWHTYPEMTAAGMWTTPSDLARIAIEIQSSNRILKPATKEAMLTEVLGGYGLGLGLKSTDGHKSFSHGGGNEGFRCFLFAYREGGRGAVVMTNGDRGGGLADEILRSIAAEYGWADYRVTEK
ncbi:MAG TPA: serine hydrolase domain-containing protein [Bryobacteraceae bacterium]|nr:serine hydrolase domain-containing protein [Bryobacteraceae bacterium]